MGAPPERAPLVCPDCSLVHPGDQRFCHACGMPLVAGGDPVPVSERHARARKVQPGYTEGHLVKVGFARNQPEAEMIAGLLLEEGVPSVIRRTGGFDVPDFLAAGPRDILVAASGEDVARQVLAAADARADAEFRPAPHWVRYLALAMVSVVIASSLAGVIVALFG